MWLSAGELREYNLQIPRLLRLAADGSGEPDVLLTGRVRSGSNTWSYFIREPSISPDGTRAAIITDGPNPTIQNPVVKFLDLGTRPPTHRPRAARGAVPRPRQPGVVARRAVRAVRAQRPRGHPRDADDPPLQPHERAGPGPDRRGRLPDAGVVARRALRRRDEDEQLRDGHRHPRPAQRGGAPPADQRRAVVQSRVVAADGRDRVLQGPARRGRPVGRAARGHGAELGRSGSPSP